MSYLATYVFLPVIFFVAFIGLIAAVRILRQYERAVVFTLGRFQKVKGPGLGRNAAALQRAHARCGGYAHKIAVGKFGSPRLRDLRETLAGNGLFVSPDYREIGSVF